MPIGTYGDFVHALSNTGDRSPEAINNRLKEKSPWYQSIMCPIRGGDVKIPDDCGLETGTVMYVERVQHSTNAQGISGLRVACPYINRRLSGGTNSRYGSNFQVTQHDSSVLLTQWGNITDSATGVGLGQYEPFSIVSSFTGLAQGHRIVSAAVYAQPLTNFAENQGDCIGFFYPWKSRGNGIPWDTYQNGYGTAVLPNNTDQGMCVRWTPINSERASYTDFFDLDHSAIGRSENDAPVWDFGVLFDYGSGNSGIEILYTIVINYEFIPEANIVNILDASPSPCDLKEEALVVDWSAEAPKAETVSPEVIGTSPGVEERENGLEQEDAEGPWSPMDMNVLVEMLPAALELGAALLL